MPSLLCRKFAQPCCCDSQHGRFTLISPSRRQLRLLRPRRSHNKLNSISIVAWITTFATSYFLFAWEGYLLQELQQPPWHPITTW